MEIYVLGPMTVTTGEVPVPLGGLIQRATLGILALRANRVIAASQLLTYLWPLGAPLTARKMVQNAVSGVRRVISTVDPSGAVSLVTQAPGYLLRIDPGRVDLTRFQCLVETARQEYANGSWEQSVRTFRRGLGLWRGAVLADLVEKGICVPEVVSVQNQRLAAYEDCFDAELACGRHHDIIGGLEEMAHAEPLRERLCCQLMIALYRCGRQVDAINAYRHIQSELAERQGIDPTPRLREVYQMILRHDARLTRPAIPAARGEADVGRGALRSTDRLLDGLPTLESVTWAGSARRAGSG